MPSGNNSSKWHAVTEQHQRSTSGKLIFKPGRHEKMDSNLRQIIHVLPRTTSFHCFQRNEREVFWGTLYSRTNKKNHHSLPTLPYGRDFVLLNKIRTKEFLKVTQFEELAFLFMEASVLWHAAGKQHRRANGQLLHLPGTRWACHRSDKSQAALKAWLAKLASLWLTEKW